MAGRLDAWLVSAAGKIEAGRKQATTPRQLLKLVGAQRRGSYVVDMIRSRMAQHHLATEPDFATVHADAEIEVVLSGEVSPRQDLMERARERFDEGRPLQLTVRELLHRFGAERRGPWISEHIARALAAFDLQTEPDFRSTYIDGPVRLVRVPAEVQAEVFDGEAVVEHAPPEPSAERGGRKALVVGTLEEARRGENLVRIGAQARLREAVSTMLLRQVSHLPVMRGDRDLKGVLRWKDIGRYLALGGGSLDHEVERVMVRATEVRTSDALMDVVPLVLEHHCVLVVDEQRLISGIITRKDLAKRLHELAQPFFLLSDIETLLRVVIGRGKFTAEELETLAGDPAHPRPVSSVHDLTLGEKKRLLEREEAWSRVGLEIEKRAFLAQLEEVRELRNDVMHFDPDSPTPDDVKSLRHFCRVLQELAAVAEPAPARAES
jgi:CBS domain-containing protein